MLGTKNSVVILECIVSYIHFICPSDDRKYTGYRDADSCVDVGDQEVGSNGEGNVFDGCGDAMNAFFEEVQDEANPVCVAFDTGES